MDRAAIEDLFAFTDYSWREYEAVIRPLGDDVLTQPAPGSGWPALRDALAHIVWAYVRWLADPAGTPMSRWNASIRGTTSRATDTASAVTSASTSTRSMTMSY